MNYISVDCHISSLDFAAVNDTGGLLKSSRAATSVNNLIGFVKSVPPPGMSFGSLSSS